MAGFGGSAFGATAFAGSGEDLTTVTDNLALTQSFALHLTAVLNEALAINLSEVVQATTVLDEPLALTASATTAGTRMNALIAEVMALQHTMTPQLTAVISEVIDLADSGTGTGAHYAALVDTMVLSGAATNTLTAMGLVTEVLALRDALASVQDALSADTLAFAEVFDVKLSAYEHLISTAVFTDLPVGMASVTVLVDDSFDLAGAVNPRVSLIAAIRDALDFSVGFTFDDVPYLALSMNAATKSLTSYTNFAFESMASFNGQTYAAGDGGLYRLGGSTDAGDAIVWRIRTGMSNLGTGKNKGLDAAYIGHTATGKIALKCIVVDASGVKRAYWYEMTPAAGATHPGRILTGRGLRSVYWGFELTNVDAGDIELDVLELHPVVFEGRLP